MEALLVPFLKSLLERLIPDPKERAVFDLQMTELMAKAEEQRAQEFIKLLEMTQPSPDRVYVWANTLIALVRPAISIAIVAAMIFAPAQILQLVQGFASAGPAGWVVLAPVLWWFFGRDIGKYLGLRFNGGIPVGSGAPEHPKPVYPFTSGSGFKREYKPRD